MVQVPNFPVTLRSVGQLSCDMTIKTEINEKNLKLENVAIANALQLEAARRTPVPRIIIFRKI